MVEPVIATTTSSATVSVGLTAILIGWLGAVGADVMMVILSAIAGSSIALTGQMKSFKESIFFVFKGVFLALILSWSASALLVVYLPSLSSPYLPSLIALSLGFLADRLSYMLNRLINLRFKNMEA